MAKYTRYDSRNKKSGNQKSKSLNGDIRIREVSNDSTKQQLNEVMYDDENDFEDLHNHQLQG